MEKQERGGNISIDNYIDNFNYSKNNDEVEGAYICDVSSFLQLYELEKRRITREWLSIFLVHLILFTGNNIFNNNKNFNNYFKIILKNQLRAGDVVCNCDNNHFVIMLTDIKRKDVRRVINRIENSFRTTYGRENKVEIKSSYYKVSGL
ncbi:MAG: hypothetical protein ACOCQ5_02405 [Halanaerobiales bacterium]